MVVLPAFPHCHCVQDNTNDTIVAIKKLLDVFRHKFNISLVFDFMETDLEVGIKDTILVLTPANIKGFIVMTTGPGVHAPHTVIQYTPSHRCLCQPCSLHSPGGVVLQSCSVPGCMGWASTCGPWTASLRSFRRYTHHKLSPI
ncbi:serine/threonine-protein kinase KIN28 isoform X3 [Oncorhynchus tshawytscha]|uniref:serine/threonine-protein kinase KIN28 isoform X3 n=1 Tax=Oncorhynchus tshawytscha TaxID=74940 RepID=UPI000D09B5CE|nr:serine/threonine-protein kinase KIN28 isoform X3 [Oncorhynchus tshawytscha]